MTRSEKHSQKKPLFWKAYFVYLGIIIAGLIAIFFYVRGTMVEYERNSSDNYVVWLAEEVGPSSELGKYLEDHNFSDDRYGDGKIREEKFYETIKSATLEAKPVPGSYDSSRPVYTIMADEKPFMDICIYEQGSSTKLGIMTLSDWQIEYAILRNPDSEDNLKLGEDGNLDYKLIVPEGFTLIIDDAEQKLASDNTVELADFEYVYDYVAAPKGIVYELNDIYYEPTFVAVNNGYEEIELKKQIDGSYAASANYASSNEAKDLANSVCDPLEIGKLWSKFMTDDVGGPSHGRNTVIEGCKILRGSSLYNQAVKWSSNVDITFVSGHTLDGWSKESVTNYIQYNENLFSCDVYFEKNMTISRGIGPRTDVFSNRMYFGKVNGTWYLLDMVTLDS